MKAGQKKRRLKNKDGHMKRKGKQERNVRMIAVEGSRVTRWKEGRDSDEVGCNNENTT